jgi:hypothetical protein
MMLITLQFARDQIRSDTTDDDAYLTRKIKSASAAVMTYLKSSAFTAAFTDSAGDVIEDSSGTAIGIPDDVQDATAVLTAYMYKQRDQDKDKEFENGDLPRPVVALLRPYRVPTVGIPTRRHPNWWKC